MPDPSQCGDNDVSLGEVMKHLSDYEIEEITQAIAGLKNISVDVMDRILEEFEQHLIAGEWDLTGWRRFCPTSS